MRKTSLILLGAAAGAALTLLAVQPRVILVGATAKAAAKPAKARAKSAKAAETEEVRPRQRKSA